MKVKTYADCVGENHQKNKKPWRKFEGAKCRVRQEFVEETDTKSIVERFFRSGTPLPTEAQSRLVYTDLTATPETLQEAFEHVEKAKAAFDALPSDLREFVGNDPRRLLEAYSSPRGREVLANIIQDEERKKAPGQGAKAAQKAKRKATSSADDEQSDAEHHEEETDEKPRAKKPPAPRTP